MRRVSHDLKNKVPYCIARDDIVDTGRSLVYARDLIAERGAAKVWTCALVDKSSRREVDCPLDFVGFTTPPTSTRSSWLQRSFWRPLPLRLKLSQHLLR